jgi:hypothetical protein
MSMSMPEPIQMSNNMNRPNPNTTIPSNMNKYDDEEHIIRDNTNIEISCKDNTGKYIYFIFHIIMSFVAIYLSWKCNNGKFNVLTFLIALFFPYIYIVYILATRGTCDKI